MFFSHLLNYFLSYSAIFFSFSVLIFTNWLIYYIFPYDWLIFVCVLVILVKRWNIYWNGENICGVLKTLLPLVQFKKWDKTNERVSLLVACNLAKSVNPSLSFSTIFKLRKWYQIVQSITWKTWQLNITSCLARWSFEGNFLDYEVLLFAAC